MCKIVCIFFSFVHRNNYQCKIYYSDACVSYLWTVADMKTIKRRDKKIKLDPLFNEHFSFTMSVRRTEIGALHHLSTTHNNQILAIESHSHNYILDHVCSIYLHTSCMLQDWRHRTAHTPYV